MRDTGTHRATTNHTDGSYMNTLSDEHLYKVVDEGGMAVGKAATMAAWGGVMDRNEINHVVAYMRTLADPPYESATQ